MSLLWWVTVESEASLTAQKVQAKFPSRYQLVYRRKLCRRATLFILITCWSHTQISALAPLSVLPIRYLTWSTDLNKFCTMTTRFNVMQQQWRPAWTAQLWYIGAFKWNKAECKQEHRSRVLHMFWSLQSSTQHLNQKKKLTRLSSSQILNSFLPNDIFLTHFSAKALNFHRIIISPTKKQLRRLARFSSRCSITDWKSPSILLSFQIRAD